MSDMPPLPLDWNHDPADIDEAREMLLRARTYAEQETAALRAEVERLKKDADMLRYWLRHALNHCDDSPEWNWGTDAAAQMRAAALAQSKDTP